MHMHTNYSDDGEFSPEELVKKCYVAGIKIMSIADHNSVKAIPRAMKKAEEYNIKYIPAIEIDCTFNNLNFHVLGYGIEFKHPDFEAIELNILEQEQRCSLEKIQLTKKAGFDVSEEELNRLSCNGVYTGEMMAEIILNKEEYRDNELLRPYRKGGSRSDNPYVNFYWDFYAQGKPCYTRIIYPTLSEVIDLIHKHGGKSVLAHPGNNLKGRFELFDEMIKSGLDGVEAFSSYHCMQEAKYFANKGKEYNIMITCGSDFHGKTKPSISLGESRYVYDENIIKQQLIENKLI